MKTVSPNWLKRLSRSLHLTHAQPESRYFQLATVSSEGKPQVRTVVYRGVNELEDEIYFVTDSRSSKYQEIMCNSVGAICWYFTATREQYRFNGQLKIYSSNSQVAKDAWKKLSFQGKKQFFWGEPKQAIDESQHVAMIENVADDPIEHFNVISLHVDEVDYLALTVPTFGRPQTREIYKKIQHHWHCQPVIP